MGIVKIKDEFDKVSEYVLKDHVIVVSEELILELRFDDSTIKYIIQTDEREPDIQSIKMFVLKNLTEEKTMYIREAFDRNYIFIGLDDNVRQFTATKE